ncbi:MAG: metal ABC transporter permease, partial [Bartonella sp.]|nr:metal ABC transporter permease [Bartonella sp.]
MYSFFFAPFIDFQFMQNALIGSVLLTISA